MKKMGARKLFQVMKLIVRLWPLYFFILWMIVMTLLANNRMDSYISTVSSLPVGIPLSKTKNYDVKCIIREELIGDGNGHTLLLQTTGISLTSLLKVQQVVRSFADDVIYIKASDDPEVISLRTAAKMSNLTKDFRTNVHKYYDMIRTASGTCQKMVRVGGVLNCDKRGDHNHMDGHKYICMIPAFQMVSRDTKNCLVLSFGVNEDTTFDEGMVNMNCEVHMFDVYNYSKAYFGNKNHLHFHKIGLGTSRTADFYLMNNITINFDNLNNIVLNIGVQDKLINVLKIDIEGTEWKVFHDMISKKYLDLVGQIAVEVHSNELKEMSHEERNKKVQHWISAIEALEARGFRRVIYWDNVQPRHRITDTDSSIYETAGELLLLNYNWYNETFREEIRRGGFNFASI